MSSNKFLRSYTAALLFIWAPIGSYASVNTTIPLFSRENTVHSSENYDQDRRDKRQDRGKERKKPDVKEVPQSRRQQKPGEVKPERKEKPTRDNRRRN